MTIEADTKDWTWVLQRPCADCGFDAADVAPEDLPERFRETASRWRTALAADDARVRPAAHIWSTLEYACHVRDAHRLFDQRVALMLAEDDPAFANWDQDQTAVNERYGEQDPVVVSREVGEATEAVAARYASVRTDQWLRTGRRSGGSVFTVEGIGRYHLHDVVHHLWDVGS